MSGSAKRIVSSIPLILFALMFCGGGIFMFMESGLPMFQLWKETRNWQPANAQLLSLSGNNSSTTARYSYSYHNQNYTGDRVHIAPFSDNIGSYHKELQNRLGRTKAAGKAVQIWVNPDNPSQSILDRSMRWGLFILLSVFCSIFIIIGLLVVRSQFRPRDIVPDAPDTPDNSRWQTKKQWRINMIRSDAKLQVIVYWSLALLIIAISLPVLFALTDELKKENYVVLLALLFPLTGLYLLISAIRTSREYLRFGTVKLVMDPFPGSIGGNLGGTIRIEKFREKSPEFTIKAQCIYRYSSGTGNDRSRHERLVWGEEGVARSSRVAGGVQLEFRFDIPGDLPQSDVEQVGDHHFWRLNLSAKLPGTDLDRSFNIPVFPTAQASQQVSHDLSGPAKEKRNQESEEIRLAIKKGDFAHAGLHGSMRITTYKGQFSLYFPMFRNRLLTLIALVFGAGFSFAAYATFTAFSGGILSLVITVLFSIPFGLVGLCGSVATVYLAFNSLHVTISEKHLRVRRQLLFLPLSDKNRETCNVARLTIKKTGSITPSGRAQKAIEQYKIIVHINNGEKLTIAEDINGEERTEDFKDFLWEKIKNCEEKLEEEFNRGTKLHYEDNT